MNSLKRSKKGITDFITLMLVFFLIVFILGIFYITSVIIPKEESYPEAYEEYYKKDLLLYLRTPVYVTENDYYLTNAEFINFNMDNIVKINARIRNVLSSPKNPIDTYTKVITNYDSFYTLFQNDYSKEDIESYFNYYQTTWNFVNDVCSRIKKISDQGDEQCYLKVRNSQNSFQFPNIVDTGYKSVINLELTNFDETKTSFEFWIYSARLQSRAR